jgi:ribosomal protein S18 acetylase RimI-like enzyme
MLTIFSSIPTSSQETKEVESASLGLSQGPFKICNASLSHLEGAKTLADANRHIFGFVTRGAFHDALQVGTLIVATRYDEVVGFLRYHHRKRDLQTTLYDICVAEPEQGKGLGQYMLTKLIECCRNSNRATILLKCPSHLAANAFYEKNGFCCISTIEGKRQKLNVWQLDLTSRG